MGVIFELGGIVRYFFNCKLSFEEGIFLVIGLINFLGLLFLLCFFFIENLCMKFRIFFKFLLESMEKGGIYCLYLVKSFCVLGFFLFINFGGFLMKVIN